MTGGSGELGHKIIILGLPGVHVLQRSPLELAGRILNAILLSLKLIIQTFNVVSVLRVLPKHLRVDRQVLLIRHPLLLVRVPLHHLLVEQVEVD